MMLAGEPQEEIDASLRELHPDFTQQIACLNRVSLETARESNPIATALGTLFSAWRNASEADEQERYGNGKANHVADFIQRHQIRFESGHCLRGVLARELFVALKRVERDFNLSFPMTSAMQFAKRFANDTGTIEEAGFQIGSRATTRGGRFIRLSRADATG